MATKLTKVIRQQIIENIMKATTFAADKERIEKQESNLTRALLAAKVPDEFNEMAKDRPSEWFAHTAQITIPKEEAPTFAFQPKTEHWNSWAYVSFEPIIHPVNLQLELSAKDLEKFKPLRKEATKIAAKFEKLETEMRAFLQSCFTVEKLLERMPELEPHIPEIAEYFPIVVSTSNLLSDLLKVGFVVQETAEA